MDWWQQWLWVGGWIVAVLLLVLLVDANRWRTRQREELKWWIDWERKQRPTRLNPDNVYVGSVGGTDKDDLTLQDFLTNAIRRLDFKILMHRPPWARADILMNLATLLLYQAQKELVKKVDVTPPEVVQRAFDVEKFRQR